MRSKSEELMNNIVNYIDDKFINESCFVKEHDIIYKSNFFCKIKNRFNKT